MLPRRLYLRMLTQLDLNLPLGWARSLAKMILLSTRERAEFRSDFVLLSSVLIRICFIECLSMLFDLSAPSQRLNELSKDYMDQC